MKFSVPPPDRRRFFGGIIDLSKLTPEQLMVVDQHISDYNRHIGVEMANNHKCEPSESKKGSGKEQELFGIMEKLCRTLGNLHLQDQPLAVQREVRDVLSAAWKFTKKGENR